MKSIFEQLDPGMLRRVKNLSLITHILRQTMPASMQLHFHVVKISQQTLSVLTDSPVWATKLRQLAPQMIKSLHAERLANTYKTQLNTVIPASLKHIQVLTRPAQISAQALTEAEKAPETQRYISKKTASLLTQTASFITDDKLSDVLKRLSRHIH